MREKNYFHSSKNVAFVEQREGKVKNDLFLSNEKVSSLCQL